MLSLIFFYFIVFYYLFFSCSSACLGVNLTEFDIDTVQQTETSSSTHHNHNHNHTASKQLHETISSEVDLTEIDELVKPSKIHVQPLHAQDLLYESTKFEPDAGTLRSWWHNNKFKISFHSSICRVLHKMCALLSSGFVPSLDGNEMINSMWWNDEKIINIFFRLTHSLIDLLMSTISTKENDLLPLIWSGKKSPKQISKKNLVPSLTYISMIYEMSKKIVTGLVADFIGCACVRVFFSLNGDYWLRFIRELKLTHSKVYL